ncbi:MAG: O-antigen ligase family protein [Thermoleophilia bacterium]|nr:O-antigen ligase family protein [Thermoleophilia bacterium]
MIEAAAVAGAAGALGAIAGRSRWVLVAGLLALAAAEAALARELVPADVSSSAAALGLAVAAPALGGLAALFVRYPGAATPAVLAAAPLRFPFEIESSNRFFIGLADEGRLGRLVPLYALVAAAGLALAWRTVRGAQPRELAPVLTVPAALLVALATASLLWADDAAAAKERIAFFVCPFAVLFAVVAHAPVRAWLPRVLAVEALALATLFAAFGLAEAWTRSLVFYDPKVAVGNAYTSYFRVTSLFSDPSIYGRHLVLAILVLLVALWLGRVALVVGIPLAAFLWAGLYFSYSQSSMLALAAGVVLVAFLVAGPRARRLLLTAAAVLVLGGGATFALLLQSQSSARVTSGRSTLLANTWPVFVRQPVVGVGIASQPAASRDQAEGARRSRRNVSHTAPLTIAAELGTVGLALYLAFLGGAVRTLWLLRTRDEALGLALLAVLAALVVHSLVYGVFLDDPIVWITVGIGAAALAAASGVVRAPTALSARPAERAAAVH